MTGIWTRERSVECCQTAVSQHQSTACESQKFKTAPCAEDPAAQRRGTGTFGVQMPASPACQACARPSEVFVPVRPEQGRACCRRTQLPPEVEFRLHTPAPRLHPLQYHQLLGELDRRPAKHIFREDRVGGQQCSKLRAASHRLVQQIVPQDALRQLQQKWNERSALRSRAAEFGLGGATLPDHRHCEVAEAVRYPTLMVKT